MKRSTWMVLAVALILAPACARGEVRDRVVKVPADDPTMNAAIAKARATVGTFVTALRSHTASRSRYSVKIRITDGDANEHFWLSDVSYDGSVFRGRIDNDPETVKNVTLGQPVSARATEISDWMYVDHGVLVGGYTLRVLRDAMSPSDRAEFDKSIPFKVE
jgi:uncharacterized protein YegJ (DUF2314 family)